MPKLKDCPVAPQVAIVPLVEDVDYELVVAANGDTLWLNAVDGSCIGRFSKRFGLDVHHSATAQMAGSGECVFCTHAPAGPADWDKFRSAILAQYGIEIDAAAIKF